MTKKEKKLCKLSLNLHRRANIVSEYTYLIISKFLAEKSHSFGIKGIFDISEQSFNLIDNGSGIILDFLYNPEQEINIESNNVMYLVEDKKSLINVLMEVFHREDNIEKKLLDIYISNIVFLMKKEKEFTNIFESLLEDISIKKVDFVKNLYEFLILELSDIYSEDKIRKQINIKLKEEKNNEN